MKGVDGRVVLAIFALTQLIDGLVSVFGAHKVQQHYSFLEQGEPTTLWMIRQMGIFSLGLSFFAMATLAGQGPTKPNLNGFGFAFLGMTILFASSMADHTIRDLGFSDMSAAGSLVYFILMTGLLLLANPAEEREQLLAAAV
eukprot:c17907_g1_i1.p1 GENE.c17907_g1_i1~~c17907_g1_i1.p1  ORF type:complete len:156 (+),score=37.63 c17907_g1_i1:44-469(+)